MIKQNNQSQMDAFENSLFEDQNENDNQYSIDNNVTEAIPVVQYLTFSLQDATYGIEVKHIKELLEYKLVSEVPRLPKFVRGVSNLRGDIIPLIDLSALFFNTLSSVTIDTSIVVVECRYNESVELIGVMIDAVRSVSNIPEDKIETTPEFGTQIPHQYIKGIGTVDDEFITLLDIEKILDIDYLINEKLSKECNSI